MNHKVVIKSFLIIGAIVVIGFLVVGRESKTNNGAGNKQFTVFDENGKKVNYEEQYPADGIVNSPRERIFSKLDQTLRAINDGKRDYQEEDVIYTANGNQSGAIAVFQFSKNKEVTLTAYIESPIFYLPFIYSDFVDLNNDGQKDIFIISHSGNYLDLEWPWFFLSDQGEYHLATPLLPDGVDVKKVLAGEVSAQNAMEIRTSAGVFFVWLRDIDGDGDVEVITLDKGSFSASSDAELTKRVYKLKDNAYLLYSEKQISRSSQEYQEVKSWPMVPRTK